MRRKYSAILAICLSGVITLTAYAQQAPDFVRAQSAWADSVFESLTPRERLAQLFMVAAYSNKDRAHVASIERLVEDYKIGGLIFFQGGPVRQARLTNHYQDIAKTPLLIGIDGEWGLSMRLDSTAGFPRQMTLGAANSPELAYAMGKEIALHCRRLGIHVNFAPVVDLNSNPKNPVINTRAFGESLKEVTALSSGYMKGMQDFHVLASAKHFPGHGNTGVDSHLDMPVLRQTRQELWDTELAPYRSLMKEGLGSIMVSHLHVPNLDNTPNVPATLSPKIIDGLLKREMGFEGLIFTDALNMKGVSKYYEPGEVELLSLLAGNDIMLFAEDVPGAITRIEKAIAEGRITQAEIDRRCMKVLKAKAWCGLDNYRPVLEENLIADLNPESSQVVRKRIVGQAITALSNQGGVLPLDAGNAELGYLSIGLPADNDFHTGLKRYARAPVSGVSASPDAASLTEALKPLEKATTVVVSIHKLSTVPKNNFGFSTSAMELIRLLSKDKQVVLVFFGNPYALAAFQGIENCSAVVVAYQDDAITRDLTSQALFGALPIRGKLPVSVGTRFAAQSGLDVASNGRLKFATPADLGIDFKLLQPIDSIVNSAMAQQAFPGCQVVAVKSGTVFYRKSFGFHTYEKTKPVKDTDLYDLASITKIAASTISLMKLYDDGLFDLNRTVGHYLKDRVPDTTQHYHMPIRDMLAHQAGLPAYLPFYARTMKDKKWRADVYSEKPSMNFPTRVAENMFIARNYEDSIMSRLLSYPLKDQGKYKYSDLGYFFIREIVKKQSGKPLNVYAELNFYQPMGLGSMGYLPMQRFKLNEIIPTEYDASFRKQLIHGDVHDPAAAMLGGVGGHAGLFSNATDLAALMQMLVNGGEYGGRRYLSAEVIEEFTRCQFCRDNSYNEERNRRGAGFDKPAMAGGGPTCECVPFESFGHSGFTGTLTWADPVNEVVYVFLSNRIYPTAENKKLLELGVRTEIQQVIYNALSQSTPSLESRDFRAEYVDRKN